MIFRIILVGLILLIYNKGNSQSSSESELFVSKLATYRSETLKKVGYSKESLKDLDLKFITYENCISDLLDLIQNINLNFISYGIHHKWYEKNIIRNFRKSDLAKELNELDLYIIHDNPELFELVANQYLTSYYPYSITLNDFHKPQIEFLELKSNEKIGEYGIGMGTFSIIMGMYNQSLKFNIFLPNLYAVNHTQAKLDSLFNHIEISNYLVVKIPEENEIAENYKVDKLIVKDVLQHLNGQTGLINYFRSLLLENGKLYIFNYFDDDTNSNCSIKLDVEKTIAAFKNEGFNLRKKLKLKNYFLLEFQVQNSNR